MRALLRYLLKHSLFLVVGAAAGLLLANLASDLYHTLVHLPLLENPYFGTRANGTRVIDLHYFVNDMAMAIFFAVAGKEVWESVLPGGPLRNPRTAMSPISATLGGMAGPALVYTLGAAAIAQLPELGRGWAIPCATDIAFSYFFARIVFGPAHPAIPFLLLLAIADDALGLLVLAIFYPVEPVQAEWLLLSGGALLASLSMRRAGVRSFWLYLLGPGVLSWIGFALSGLHPALGLLPIIPTLPHAHTDLGIFMRRELARQDTLSELAAWWKKPLEGILCVFGLVNAGVVLGAVGAPTWLVLAGLLIGKPVGIFVGGWLAARVFGLGLPAGMTDRDLFVVGCVAAVGFTVALFVSVVAFPAGPVQDAAKMGALLSIIAGGIALAASRVLGIEKREVSGSEPVSPP
jgi:Na+:H+ antiporter, NhaA family